MTTENSFANSTQNLNDSSSIYLIAGRLDAQSKLMAKRLHEVGIIYAIYGALDGLSLSYSMLKYLFDLICKNANSSDAMHEWMLTPEGIAIAASSTISLIVFAMLANHFKDDDKNQLKSFIATVWPYCRDTMKGLKNAYKGFRSAIQVIDLLGGHNLNFMIVPVGVALGVLSAINRIWLRYHVNIRKDMMKANSDLFDAIKDKNLSLEEIAKKRDEIQSQSISLRRQMLLSAAYGGVVDGLYLYVGVLSLCSLAPTVFLAMTIFCAIYFVACIATRIYEEYDFQRRLVITQADIELALCGKELEVQFEQLNILAEVIAKAEAKEEAKEVTEGRLQQHKELVDTIGSLRSEFEKKRAYLRELTTLSYSSAFLAGVKNGLAAYGALASVMFAVATMIVLASAAFPPALLITCISMGMGLLIAFTAHALVHAYRHQIKHEATVVNNPRDEKLNEILQTLKTNKQYINEIEPERVKTAITDGMAVDPSPQFFFQEWFEVVRSACSGLGKGFKAVQFTRNDFRDADYHDSSIMLGVTVVSALVHGSVLALRAHARGFGKKPVGTPSLVKMSKTDESTATSSAGESEQASKLNPDSPPGMSSPTPGGDTTTTTQGSSPHQPSSTVLPSENNTSPTANQSLPNSIFGFFFKNRIPTPTPATLPRAQSTEHLNRFTLLPVAPAEPVSATTPSPMPIQYW